MNSDNFPHRPPRWWRHQPESREMRRRFFLRFGILIALLLFFSCAVFALLVSVISNLLDAGNVPRPLVILAVIFVFMGLVSVGGSFRRFALPIGDVIAASSRVANGDYSVRVREHGPREVRVLAHAFNSMAERLQASDQTRRAMLADVTHELRTPLTVIQGNLEGLIDGVYPRDDAHLQPILDETHVLSRLIDDLRLLALAESGALQLQKEPTDVATLIGETITSFRAQADVAGIALNQTLAPNLPTLDLDPARIRQVLENLMMNALRFTARDGAIRVSCTIENGTRVVVAVSDTGRGIAPEELPHIFDRFYKARDSHGTGLGLAIAKKLIEAHGGEISAQSELGKGTTIQIRFPDEEKLTRI